MTCRPEDFDTMANPCTLWRATAQDLPPQWPGESFAEPAEIILEYRGSDGLDLSVTSTDDPGYSIGIKQYLSPEAIAELRDQLDAWLKWTGHDRRCDHTIARFSPYCSEMVCHNYAGRRYASDD